MLLRRLGINPFLALALSTSLAAWTHFGILAWGLRRRAGTIAGHGVVRATLSMVAVSLAMGLASAGVHAAMTLWIPGAGHGLEIVRLGCAVAVGIAIAIGGAYALHVPEAHAAVSVLARVARRKPRA